MTKPPIGANPHWFVYFERIVELTNAIQRTLQYISVNRAREDVSEYYKQIAQWSEELKTLASLEARYNKEG